MRFVIEPEVAGGFGRATVLDTRTHPPQVSRLEYEFDGWLGDDLLTTFPCYIVSRRLQDALEMTDLTGFHFDGLQHGYGTDEAEGGAHHQR